MWNSEIYFSNSNVFNMSFTESKPLLVSPRNLLARISTGRVEWLHPIPFASVRQTKLQVMSTSIEPFEQPLHRDILQTVHAITKITENYIPVLHRTTLPQPPFSFDTHVVYDVLWFSSASGNRVFSFTRSMSMFFEQKKLFAWEWR